MLVVKRDPTKGYIDNYLWVPRTFINVPGTMQGLTFTHTERSNATRVITLYKEAPYHLLVPRAFWRVDTLPFEVIDTRPQSYFQCSMTSRVKLDHRMQLNSQGQQELLPTGSNVQESSFLALQQSMGGVLKLGCGIGKTAIALHHIAHDQVPTLVLVDNTQLLNQWIDAIAQFLDVPGGVGLLAKGKRDWQKQLVLGTYTSTANWADDMPEEVRRWFGAVYWDEGHHLSAPVFAKTADLFYGKRFCLTATPERIDGFHVIADMHVGKVLYEYLKQPLTARIIFYWTGLKLDLTDPTCNVLDKNNEVHISKVFSYLGRWKQRLLQIIQDCIHAVREQRRVLVVVSGVDEVVNLMAIWTRGANTPLLSDIPFPTPAEVGETLLPLEIDKAEADKLKQQLVKRQQQLTSGKNHTPGRVQELQQRIIEIQTNLQRYAVYVKCNNLYERRRHAFIKDLAQTPSSAGFLTFGVPLVQRTEFLKTRQVIFSIMKYGKEGLDAPTLDTILASVPFTQKGAIQQLLGRITGRPSSSKKPCMVVFYRDDIGIMHGMCDKVEKHLRNWPIGEGGPLQYEHINNPARVKWQKASSLKQAFGQ